MIQIPVSFASNANVSRTGVIFHIFTPEDDSVLSLLLQPEPWPSPSV